MVLHSIAVAKQTFFFEAVANSFSKNAPSINNDLTRHLPFPLGNDSKEIDKQTLDIFLEYKNVHTLPADYLKELSLFSQIKVVLEQETD